MHRRQWSVTAALHHSGMVTAVRQLSTLCSRAMVEGKRCLGVNSPSLTSRSEASASPSDTMSCNGAAGQSSVQHAASSVSTKCQERWAHPERLPPDRTFLALPPAPLKLPPTGYRCALVHVDAQVARLKHAHDISQETVTSEAAVPVSTSHGFGHDHPHAAGPPFWSSA